MNFIQRFKFLLNPTTILKESVANRSLFSMLGFNQVQWMDPEILNYINQGYLWNEDVYSAIEYIARKGASVPWKLVKMLVSQEFSYKWDNPGGSGNASLGVGTQAQAEVYIIPGGLWVLPLGELVTPHLVTLRPPEHVRIRCGVKTGNAAIGKGDLSFRRFVVRPHRGGVDIQHP